ncbi:hypothetical protein E1281_31545 [Actinomadura sp. KC345]|uniref:hypothetical protein n=1 Tax=Actinomadura sp. KC345 TaxID=2530371 RepID=UPI001042C423|nr:hypothetical protein [Actinomadura sp. KC345]TDC45084.1 hypothetical protein E1281_31545 [Actinomadura sp. KC345]
MTQRGAKIGMFLATLVAALMGVSVLSLAHAEPAAAAAAASPESASPQRGAPAGDGRVVIVGVPGLLWSDVTEKNTPALWGLTAEGSAASLSVRTTRVNTCPTDAWLTVSAGQRSRLPHGDCALPAAPILSGQNSPTGPPPAGGAIAPGWPAIKSDNADTNYHAQIGLLGDAVKSAGGCTTAVGPGAVFGVGDGGGRVDRYIESPGKVTAADWARCRLAAVEIDDVFRAYIDAGVDPEGEQYPLSERVRAAAAAAADRQVGQVMTGLPEGTTVLLAGLSDIGVDPHLRVAIAKGGGGTYKPGYMRSSATRQDGLVTLTDVTATALEVLGLPQPKQAVGSTWQPEPSDETTTERVESLEDSDVAAQAIRTVQTSFYWVLFATQLVLYGVAVLALRRLGGDRRSRARILGGTRVIALLGGAAPGASFLAGLLPWWRADNATPVLICTVLGFAGLLTGLALAGPWRRSAFAPGLVISGITATVLALDVMSGSNLQLNTLMGYTALVAGRFYGFGNQAFSLFAVASILTAAWLSEYPLRGGRRALALGIVVVIGTFAVLVDGLPAWGSDFGGVLAMVPAFAILGLMVTGRRVSALKLGLFGLAGAVLVLFISYLNSRSASPTHLGRFWDDLVDGEAWGIVTRKFDAMVNSLGYWPYTLAVAAAVVFLFFVLARPTRWRVSVLQRAYEHSLTMRPALISALTVGVIGMLVNDSGVVILSVSLSLATPLMLAAGVRALEIDLRNEDSARSEPSGPRRESTESPSAERR